MDDDHKAQLAQYKSDFKALSNPNPRDFDINKVAVMIMDTPPRKWAAAEGVANATILMKAAERKLKTLRATKMIQANDRELSSAKDREAWVENQQEIQSATEELDNAKVEHLIAKLAYDCLDDMFTAGKKIMDWKVRAEREQLEYDKYRNEGLKNK